MENTSPTSKVLITLATLFSTFLFGASEQKQPTLNIEKPLFYEADDQKGRLDGHSVLTGHVKMVQEDMTLFTDRAELFWKQNPMTPMRVVLDKNVRFHNETTRGFCEHAVFFNAQRKLTMQGNPVVYRGKTKVEGDFLTYFIDDETFAIQAVKALLVPHDENVQTQVKTAQDANKPAQPIYYEADRQTGNLDGNSLLLGHVKILQEGLALDANKAELFWQRKPARPLRVVLTKDVRFKKGDIHGHCQHGVFYNDQRKLVMTGNPVIYRGKTKIEAKQIIYFIATEKFTLKGVKALAVPQQKLPKTDKQNKPIK